MNRDLHPIIRFFSATVFLLFSNLATAELQWNLYGTVGFGKVDNQSVVANSALAYTDYTEEFESKQLTRFGIQPSYRINEKTSITLQAVTRESQNFDLEVEWGYLNYNVTDNASLRFGLIRRPLFQYTDSLYVGYGYRWIQPPATAYVDIDELYGNIGAINFLYNGVFGDWLYATELYFGGGSGEGTFVNQKTTNKSKNNMGIVLNVEQDDYSLRFGLHSADFSLAIDQIDQIGFALEGFGLGRLADEVLLKDESVLFYSVAGSYILGDWEFYGESVSVDVKGTYIPNIDSHYLGVQRRFGDVSLHFTIGEQETSPEVDPSIAIRAAASQIPDPVAAATLDQIGQQLAPIVASGNASRTSKSIGLRYDLNPAVALKAEFELVKDKALNESANMYSISVDFVY